MSEFEPFPKIARLNRNIVITEKIDGTNAQIYIREHPDLAATPANAAPPWPGALRRVLYGDMMYTVQAGSRKRWITPDDDNFGFARWVNDNADELITLGEGRHYGEWWGCGIQRRYGLDEKRFSLFNTGRWLDNPDRPQCCYTVPVLYDGPWSEEAINEALRNLTELGSAASSEFMDPEGIVVFHKASRQLFKVTIKNDEVPKGSLETR